MSRTDLLAILAFVASVLGASVLVGVLAGNPWAGAALGGALTAGGLLAAQLASHRVLKARLDRLRVDVGGVQTLVGLYHTLPIRAPLPPSTSWSAAPDLLALIAATVAEHGPTCVVECGSGTSSLVGGYALERNGGGRLISLDHDAEFAAQTAAHVERHRLGDVVKVRVAPLTEADVAGGRAAWYAPEAWADLDGIDLLVVDGPPANDDATARWPALPLLYDRLAPGAIVVVDDAGRPGEREIVRRWREAFPDLEATYHPTVKGTYVLRKRAAT